MASTRINADGLVERYGTDQAAPTKGGENNTDGAVREIEINLTPRNAPAVADNLEVLSYHNILPKGAFIKEVEIVGEVDFTGTGTLNVGLVDYSDFSSNSAGTALINAATVAEINAGTVNDSGWVGAAVGTVLTANKALTWEVNTDALAAGNAVIVVRYVMPPKATDTLGTVLS